MKNYRISDRLRKLIELSGVYYTTWEYNKATSHFSCDREFTNILGSGCEPIYQKEIFAWLNESSEFVEEFDRLINTYKNLDIAIPIKKNGSNVILRIVGLYCPVDFVFYGSIKNITQEILKETQFRNRNLEMTAFENGLEQFSIVARTDSRGHITYANEEFCRLSKYTQEELIGNDHRIINSGHHPKEFFKDMWSCINAGKNWRGVIKNKAKDGTFYWVDTIIIPFLNTRGVITEILSLRFDITQIQEIKEENSRLRLELDRLKISNQKLQDF